MCNYHHREIVDIEYLQRRALEICVYAKALSNAEFNRSLVPTSSKSAKLDMTSEEFLSPCTGPNLQRRICCNSSNNM